MFLVLWGERNSSNFVVVDLKSVLNGMVLCLWVNEIVEGSRSIEEIVEDGVVMVGGGWGLVIVFVVLMVVMIFGF